MRSHLSAADRRKLDRFEQIAVVLLYGWLVARVVPGAVEKGGLLAVLLLLLSEGMVVVLILFRRPTAEISLRLGDWLIAAAGTFLPLLVSSGDEPIFGFLGAYLLLAGMLIHISAKLTLLRSFGLVAANRGIKVGGPYSYVRHPMYAGYMLTHIGFLLSSPSAWNAAVYVAVWSFLLARIVAEERILSRDPGYREYARTVRHRIVPGLY